jgi:hypothetical protein
MLYTLAFILLVFWVLGLVSSVVFPTQEEW